MQEPPQPHRLPSGLNKCQILKRKIASYTMVSFPIIAGVLFTAGSVVYWPSLTGINPATGGILFIVGSSMFFITDFCAMYIEPEFNPFKPLSNLGSFKALCTMLGNINFIVGSVYFLPNFYETVGDDIFIIASIFLFIPQVFAIWGVSHLNHFTGLYYAKFISFRKEIIWMNICMAIGCTGFFVGTFLFKNEQIEVEGLLQEGVIMFIVGSFLFFLSSVIGLRLKKTIHIDPLWVYRTKIIDEFLPFDRKSHYSTAPDRNSYTDRSFHSKKIELSDIPKNAVIVEAGQEDSIPEESIRQKLN